MDVSAYLDRIGYVGSTAPTAATLTAVHTAHLLTVPFENLDIHLGREIVLDEDRVFAKVVHDRRGGFCYELNGLFGALLRQIGFGVTLASTRFPLPEGQIGYSQPFDHLTLLVTVAGSDHVWLADVAAGRFASSQPLQLAPDIEQIDPHDGTPFRLTRDGDDWRMWRRETDGEWIERYRVSPEPRHWAEFAGMCRYHQTSPDSPFPVAPMCSRLMPDGRVTIRDSRLIVTRHGTREEHALGDDAAVRAALRDHIGVEISGAFVLPREPREDA